MVTNVSIKHIQPGLLSMMIISSIIMDNLRWVGLLQHSNSRDKIGKVRNIFNSKTEASKHLFPAILPDHIILNLKGKTKEAIINELLDLLASQGKLLNRDTALKDLLSREQAMSTAIPNGIAIPHAKTNAVQELTIAIGIKKSGLDFDSPLDDKARIIILALTSPDKPKPLYEFLLVITAALNDDTLRSKILAAKTPEKVAELLRQYK